MTNLAQVPRYAQDGFDTTHSLTLVRIGSTNFTTSKPVEPGSEHPLPKPVEPGSEERATRVETTPHPAGKPNPKAPDTVTLVSTRPTR